MRILGVDYGDARVGLAISDEMQIIASPLPPLQAISMRKTIDAVCDAAKNNDAQIIVVGLPLNMNGTEGPQANKVKAFAEKLKIVSGLKVELMDERLTTVFVSRAFDETGVKKIQTSSTGGQRLGAGHFAKLSRQTKSLKMY